MVSGSEVFQEFVAVPAFWMRAQCTDFSSFVFILPFNSTATHSDLKGHWKTCICSLLPETESAVSKLSYVFSHTYKLLILYQFYPAVVYVNV